MCVLLFPVHVTVFGAHVAPDVVRGALILLYEFTVGFVIAAIAVACFMIPPRKLYPLSDNPSSFLSSAKAFIVPDSSQTEICA